jgi:hypothetical protein
MPLAIISFFNSPLFSAQTKQTEETNESVQLLHDKGWPTDRSVVNQSNTVLLVQMRMCIFIRLATWATHNAKTQQSGKEGHPLLFLTMCGPSSVRNSNCILLRQQTNRK